MAQFLAQFFKYQKINFLPEMEDNKIKMIHIKILDLAKSIGKNKTEKII